MDVIAMFKEAAKALQQDERCRQLFVARQVNDNDGELQDMIGEFNLARLDLNNETEKDIPDEARVKELETRINGLYNDIMTRPSMLAYNEAKQNMTGLVAHINAIVAAAIDGEDPMLVTEPVEGGCSADGCSSCSGCS